MSLFASAPDPIELDLDDLSREVHISKQTLVRWTDRGFIDAALGWGINEHNEEQRLIHIQPSSHEMLNDFAEEYRDGTVTRTEARRILKLIDRNQVQKLLRHGDIKSKRVKGETRVTVGSIEDYLMRLEAEEKAAV
ncbi:MAG: hypothetical protein AAF624_16550 [Bacteroidota bacterium]